MSVTVDEMEPHKTKGGPISARPRSTPSRGAYCLQGAIGSGFGWSTIGRCAWFAITTPRS